MLGLYLCLPVNSNYDTLPDKQAMPKLTLTPFERKLITALGAIQFLHIVDFMLLMPLGPKLMRVLEISPTQFGLLVSCYTFAAGVSGLLAAIFMDRYDRKTMLLTLFGGFTLGTFACGWANQFYFLLAARVVAGAFGGILNSLTFSILGDVVPLERRATATGYVMTAFSLASIVGVPLSLFISDHYGWEAPFLVLGGASFAIFFVLKVVFPNLRDHLDQPRRKWHAPMVSAITEKGQRNALIFQGCLTLSQFSIVPFISPSLVANAGMAESQLPLVYITGGIIAIVAGPMFGRFADLKGRKAVFIFSALVSLIPIFLVSRLTPHPLPVLLAVTCFFFFTSSGRMVPAIALLTSVVKPAQRGSFMSMGASMQQFASALGSFIAGHMIEAGPNGTFLHYPSVGNLSMVTTLLAVALVLRVQPVES